MPPFALYWVEKYRLRFGEILKAPHLLNVTSSPGRMIKNAENNSLNLQYNDIFKCDMSVS